jgi:hypothetical protein
MGAGRWDRDEGVESGQEWGAQSGQKSAVDSGQQWGGRLGQDWGSGIGDWGLGMVLCTHFVIGDRRCVFTVGETGHSSRTTHHALRVHALRIDKECSTWIGYRR